MNLGVIGHHPVKLVTIDLFEVEIYRFSFAKLPHMTKWSKSHATLLVVAPYLLIYTHHPVKCGGSRSCGGGDNFNI